MPASAPFRVIRKLQGWEKRNLLMKRTTRPPVDAPRMVLTMARATILASPAPEILPLKHVIMFVKCFVHTPPVILH